MRTILLHGSITDAWELMPQACERIEAFCRKYESKADPTMLTRTLKVHFVAQVPQIVCMVAVDGDRIVAHALAQVGEFFGSHHLEITQYEADVPIPPIHVWSGIGTLSAWARTLGAGHIQIAARNPAVARLFRRKYGFEQKQTLMHREIPAALVSEG
jgi:hypothetical protein